MSASRCNTVLCRWKALVDQSLAELHPSSRLAEPEVNALLRCFPNLTALNEQKRFVLGDSSCQLLSGHTRLRSLCLSFTVTTAGIEALAGLGSTLHSFMYYGAVRRAFCASAP
jgi:hypothetical protein